MIFQKPFSQACENNKKPIVDVLKKHFSNASLVLEIGSGTGQHAVFMAPVLAHLKWQPSDREEYIDGVKLWVESEPAVNLLSPIVLDVEYSSWPSGFDAVYSANTAHIMAWEQVEMMFKQVATALPEGGVFALYGPFNYAGKYTSESNRQFDLWLKGVRPSQGIRDFEMVEALAIRNGLSLVDDVEMPANNRTLVWQKLV